MAVAVSLINMKGGVGKTTVAAQLAHAVAADGLRVLAVDLDPQSNLSHSIMGPAAYADHLTANRPTIAQILQEFVPPGGNGSGPRALAPEHIPVTDAGSGSGSEGKLDLIPSRLELSHLLMSPTGRERQLARYLSQLHDQYDLVVIDCAPTESLLTRVAYFASRYVVVPVKPEFLATLGMPLLERSIVDFKRAHADHELDIAGLILNDQSGYADSDEKGRSTEAITAYAKDRGWKVFQTRIPYSLSYARASRNRSPISHTSFARWDRIEGFLRLKDEILDSVGLGERR